MLGQKHELGVQILELVVGLADAAAAVGHCDHGHGRRFSTSGVSSKPGIGDHLSYADS